MKKLSAAGEQYLADKLNYPDYKIIINGTEFSKADIINYNLEASIDFASTQLTFEILSPNGKYTPGGNLFLGIGAIVELQEGFSITNEWFSRFYGILRQVTLKNEGSKTRITAMALDLISKLEELEIKYEKEATKLKMGDPTPEILTSVPLDPPNEKLSMIFEFANYPVAEFPPPVIKMRKITDQLIEPGFTNFEINFLTGKLKVDFATNPSDFEIIATYHYYSDTFYAEDLIEEIIIANDGYGNAPFTIADNLTETFSNVTGLSVDTMTPNQFHEKIVNVGNFAPGQIWYLKFSNIQTALVPGNFTVPAPATSWTVDLRYGRILLDKPLAASQVVTCNVDYTFKTLQATGVKFTYWRFAERDGKTRLAALKEIKEKLPPNYMFQTFGTKKIWGLFLKQKLTEDYTLKMKKTLESSTDLDSFTRVKIFGRNANPTNIMLAKDTKFTEFSAIKQTATSTPLTFDRDLSGGEEPYFVYKSGLSDEGRILDDPPPRIYIDTAEVGVGPWSVTGLKLKGINETKFIRGQGSIVVQEMQFMHRFLDPNYVINIYNSTGVNHIRVDIGGVVSRSEDNGITWIATPEWKMFYELGILKTVGIGLSNIWPALYLYTMFKDSATADYWVHFPEDSVKVDLDPESDTFNAFFLHRNLYPTNLGNTNDPNWVPPGTVTATFDYEDYFIPTDSMALARDKDLQSQYQIEWMAKPLSGAVLISVDFGSVKPIQLMDIMPGAFLPPSGLPARGFEYTDSISIEFSTDGSTWSKISKETTAVKFTSGNPITFDESQLKVGFKTRYLRIILEEAERINYTPQGRWAFSLIEWAVYTDIVLEGESKLVTDYRKIADNNIYDMFGLYAKFGDKLFKDTEIKKDLDTQEKINDRARKLLRELSRLGIGGRSTIVYHPSIWPGDTVRVIDTINNIDTDYFVRAIANNTGELTLTLLDFSSFPVPFFAFTTPPIPWMVVMARPVASDEPVIVSEPLPRVVGLSETTYVWIR